MGGFNVSAGSAMSITSSLGPGARKDPALAHHFSVEIDGLIVGGFTEVSGLSAEVQMVKIPDGGQNDYVEQRINGVNYPKLVLKRGLTTADMLWLWHRDVCAGNITRRNGSIVLMTKDNSELWRWNFHDAYPVTWTGPAFRADQAQVAFESIELVHRGISKDLGPKGALSASGGISAGASLGASFG
jgi:phage tail-like protein